MQTKQRKADKMQTEIEVQTNIVDNIDVTTAEIEQSIKDMLDKGVAIELGNIPEAIYTKHEYSGKDSLYIIIPQHKTAIPLHGRNLQATIVKVLVDNKDLKSSQDITDYPIVTDNHINLWYSDYNIVEHLVVVEVYKQRATLSGWEQRKIKDRQNAKRGHSKLFAKLKELEQDPFYAIMSEDEQRAYRLSVGINILGKV